VLPIGGLKEKLLAAHRGGITTVLIPAENEKDLVDIPENIKRNLIIKPVHWIDEVLQVALQYMPVPAEKATLDEQGKNETDVAKSTATGLTAH
jgi:ATP-dependent Lon protease